MKKLLIVFMIILACSLLSCQRVYPTGDIKDFAELKSIPAEYGTLVSVTAFPGNPNWVQMWFQDKDSNIRIVRVQFDSNQMFKDVRLITRN